MAGRTETTGLDIPTSLHGISVPLEVIYPFPINYEVCGCLRLYSLTQLGLPQVRIDSQTRVISEEIVDLRILEEGSEQLQLTSVDIEMLCDQAINNLLESARSRRQQIRLAVGSGSRIGLLDKDKVRQIFNTR